jgi:hypothetical protein
VSSCYPEKKKFLFESYLLRNDMTSQATPRGHHPAPQRGKILGTEPKLGAPIGFQCQGKTTGETKVLTSMMVKEGSLGSRVRVSWRVQMPDLESTLQCLEALEPRQKKKNSILKLPTKE